MPSKGNINIVHDEQIWRDHIRTGILRRRFERSDLDRDLERDLDRSARFGFLECFRSIVIRRPVCRISLQSLNIVV